MNNIEPRAETLCLHGLNYRLEFDPKHLNRLLLLGAQTQRTQALGRNDRLVLIALNLRTTPFAFETNLPELQRNEVRIRLTTLDCTTFVYMALALCQSNDLPSLCENVFKLRYANAETRKVDNDIVEGNLFDFVLESLYRNAISNGLLRDVTYDVAADLCEQVTLLLEEVRRPSIFDLRQQLVIPRLPERQYILNVIRAGNVSNIASTMIRSGDIVLFLRLACSEPCGFIRHLGFAIVDEGKINILHSTRHFAWRPNATASTAAAHSGIFLKGDPKREQLGVEFAGVFAGDETTVSCDGIPYFGYDQRVCRELADYAMNFDGIIILRVVEKQ